MEQDKSNPKESENSSSYEDSSYEIDYQNPDSEVKDIDIKTQLSAYLQKIVFDAENRPRISIGQGKDGCMYLQGCMTNFSGECEKKGYCIYRRK